jgi:hypothetical protein
MLELRMVDLALERFARELASEVDEAFQPGQESPYHEQEFARIVLDRLADDGATDNELRRPRTHWND